MFPLWESVIAPVLDAAGARRVVEIGALRGDTTVRVLQHLGPGAELHVIDPSPGFDPSGLAGEGRAHCVVHKGLSLDVLPDLGPVDAALIDGDHNWYTVLHELRALAATAHSTGAPLPVLVLHDVGWPYGRRDLYYDPATVPEEHRQPHRRAGMRPGTPGLLRPGHGLSQGHWNAEVEGGPRNGVRTALEDFIGEHDGDLRTVDVPLYFGLAVVVERSRLDATPGLVEVLDDIESVDGRRSQVELAELIRLRAAAHHHTVVRRSADAHDRLARRYLDTVLDVVGGPTAGRAQLIAALDDLRDTADGRGGGDIAVVTADPGAVALARAHLAAHELGWGLRWLTTDHRRAPTAGEDLAALLDRLGLERATTVVDDSEAARAGAVAVVEVADGPVAEDAPGPPSSPIGSASGPRVG